jgi:hypothetical protein
MAPMLAEIFMLRLESLARRMNEANGDDSRFRPIVLPASVAGIENPSGAKPQAEAVATISDR